MTANLIIGSSHSLQLARCLGPFEATWRQASEDLIPIPTSGTAETCLLFTTHRPSFIEFRRDGTGHEVVVFGSLFEKVRAFNAPGSKVVFAIGGNEHNIRFLRAGPQPFDFVHPSVPITDPTRQILPRVEMTALLEGALAPALTVTRAIADQIPRSQRYCIAPPPPIPSEAHLRSQPEIFDFEAHGVESAPVRLKIYNVCLEILEAFSREAGLAFLGPPPDTRDDAGYLREAFWSGATHARPEYYDWYVAELGLRG